MVPVIAPRCQRLRHCVSDCGRRADDYTRCVSDDAKRVSDDARRADDYTRRTDRLRCESRWLLERLSPSAVT